MPSKDKTIRDLVAKVLSIATFNSDGTEFYAKYRVGKAQRRICTDVLSEYTQVIVDGKTWWVRAYPQWSESMPIHFCGTSRLD